MHISDAMLSRLIDVFVLCATFVLKRCSSLQLTSIVVVTRNNYGPNRWRFVPFAPLFEVFHQSKIDSHRFNYDSIVFNAKVQRLIDYKFMGLFVLLIFTKVLNNRAISLADKIISKI